jgi:hypothetical protein
METALASAKEETTAMAITAAVKAMEMAVKAMEMAAAKAMGTEAEEAAVIDDT